MKFTPHAMLAAAAIAIAVPSVATAQDTVNSTDTVTTAPVQDDDNDFPWGLLGLLGLAGLLGRKRNDHIHVDRTDNVNRR
jgi:MYXO-CTERM domain-containing protein